MMTKEEIDKFEELVHKYEEALCDYVADEGIDDNEYDRVCDNLHKASGELSDFVIEHDIVRFLKKGAEND
ncbi:MAG: hypothetical protein LUC44_06075 [Prevotellaceae bacterium]|nr:hypothetical protein [Prevotellaceae bacterium]